jgi:hypothetical protein
MNCYICPESLELAVENVASEVLHRVWKMVFAAHVKSAHLNTTWSVFNRSDSMWCFTVVDLQRQDAKFSVEEQAGQFDYQVSRQASVFLVIMSWLDCDHQNDLATLFACGRRSPLLKGDT